MKIYVFAFAVLTTIRSASLLGLLNAYRGFGGPNAVGGNAQAFKVLNTHAILRRSGSGHDRAGDDVRTIKVIHQQSGSQAGYRQGSYGAHGGNSGDVQIIRIVHVQDNGLGGSDSYGSHIGNGDNVKTIQVIHQSDDGHGSYDTANVGGSNYRQGHGGQRNTGDAVKTIRVVHKHTKDRSNLSNDGAYHGQGGHSAGHNSVKNIKVIHQQNGQNIENLGGPSGQRVSDGGVKNIKVIHEHNGHVAENLGASIKHQDLSSQGVPDEVLNNINVIHQHESHHGHPGPSVSDGPIKSIEVLHQHENLAAENPGANTNYQDQSEQSLSVGEVPNVNSENLGGNIAFQGSSEQGESGGLGNTINIVHQQADTSSQAYGDNGAYDDNSVSADYGDNIKSIEVLPQTNVANANADYSSDSVLPSGGILYDSYGNSINGNSDRGYGNGNSYIQNSNYANTYFNDNNASSDINSNVNTYGGFTTSNGNNAPTYTSAVYRNEPATGYLPIIRL